MWLVVCSLLPFRLSFRNPSHQHPPRIHRDPLSARTLHDHPLAFKKALLSSLLPLCQLTMSSILSLAVRLPFLPFFSFHCYSCGYGREQMTPRCQHPFFAFTSVGSPSTDASNRTRLASCSPTRSHSPTSSIPFTTFPAISTPHDRSDSNLPLSPSPTLSPLSNRRHRAALYVPHAQA